MNLRKRLEALENAQPAASLVVRVLYPDGRTEGAGPAEIAARTKAGERFRVINLEIVNEWGEA